MCRLNRKGPRMDPCGTPHVIFDMYKLNDKSGLSFLEDFYQ